MYGDPFMPVAERCVLGILDPVAPLKRGVQVITGPHPTVVAYRGCVPPPGWPRAFYWEAGRWVDTETGELWNGETDQAR